MAQANTLNVGQIALKTVGWCLITFLFLVVVGILGGPRFNPILDIIGLDVADFRGIFIDCSKSANRSHDFCKTGVQRLARQPAKSGLREIDKNSLPFTLHKK